MVRRKEYFSFRPLVTRGLLVFGLLGLFGCQAAPATPDSLPTATATAAAGYLPTGTVQPTEAVTATATATATVTTVPTELPTPTATRKARIPIRNVLIVGSSTVHNIEVDVLNQKDENELNCEVIAPYCLTARGVGGLRVSQVRDKVKTTADFDKYQALVLYDPQNSMTFDRSTGGETYIQHRLTVDWMYDNHPDVLVVSGTALDTTREDDKGKVELERDNYNNILIYNNGLKEIVFDPRDALRLNGQPDPGCFSNDDQLHVNLSCERRILGVLKKTLDGWQNSGLTVPVNQRLPLFK